MTDTVSSDWIQVKPFMEFLSAATMELKLTMSGLSILQSTSMDILQLIDLEAKLASAALS